MDQRCNVGDSRLPLRRRDFIIALGGGAIGWPLVARAQKKTVPAIGFLSGTWPGPIAPAVAVFRQGLSETGYVEGQNITIEDRWAEGRHDRLPALAADLVAHKVDAIVTTGGTNAAVAPECSGG